MPNYHRAFRPGGTFFFTLVAFRRRETFRDPSRVESLRAAARQVLCERPYQFVASVVLPDHMHFIWTLPDGDSDFSRRLGRFKALFTKSLELGERTSEVAHAQSIASRMYGNAASGNTRSATNATSSGISITSTTIQ